MKIGNLFYRTVKKFNRCRPIQALKPKKKKSLSACYQKGCIIRVPTDLLDLSGGQTAAKLNVFNGYLSVIVAFMQVAAIDENDHSF
jgi:hypothetical protein